MFKIINTFIFKLFAWKIAPAVPAEAQKCVMIASPHTSNWDFFIVVMAFNILGIPLNFTIKDDWMKFPFNLIIGPMGGLAIDRSPKKPGEKRKSMVEAMGDLFHKKDRLAVIVTPEGSRSLRKEWRSGFYHTAILGNVPICLGYLDYKTKTAGVGSIVIYPKIENYEKDMKTIAAFYKTIGPKHPERFSVDERFDS